MEKIQAALILEIMGRPKEHVDSSLVALVDRLCSEKGVKLLSKQIHDSKKVEKSETLFSTFAEIEAEFESMNILFGVLFTYMPSHVEIIYPEKLSIKNFELNEFASSVLKRLHNYDGVTKKVLYEKEILTQKLREVTPHLFKTKESATISQQTQKEKNVEKSAPEKQSSKKNLQEKRSKKNKK